MKSTKNESILHRGRVFAFASLFIVWLIAAFATTAQADALAQPTNAVAREHFVTGNRYYHLREFERAVEEYKAGAIREPAPVFHYNLGQCYRQLGRYKDALWHYERFLNDGKPTGEVEALVKKLIAQMKDEIEKAVKQAEIEKAVKQPPAQPAPPPPPPRQTVGTLTVSPPAERSRGLLLQRKLAIGVGAAGAASLGVGLALGLRAQALKGDATEICPIASCARAEEANELVDRGKTNALYANVAYGVGAVAILGATVLWIAGSPAKHRDTAFAPQLSRTFAGVAAFRSF